MKIVVLAGGLSPERDVSLSSGCMICNALAHKGHAVVLVDVFMGIEKPDNGLASLFKKIPDYQDMQIKIPSTPPDLKKLWHERKPDTGNFFGQNVLELCKLADVTFFALHGDAGENGQIQAAFDLMNIPYTGSGYIGCMLGMDKNLAKILMTAAGIPNAKWVHVPDPQHPDWQKIDQLGWPKVVKPTNGGSSIGTYIVNNQTELELGIKNAAAVAPDLVIEAYLAGREFCVGVMDGKALPPVEIIPNDGFFDYEKKYQPGLTQEICPARIPDEHAKLMMDAAVIVHRELQLGYYSRIDFRMEDNGNFGCLEANTLPGMTPASLFPQEVAAVGILYEDMCDLIVKNAFHGKKYTV